MTAGRGVDDGGEGGGYQDAQRLSHTPSIHPIRRGGSRALRTTEVVAPGFDGENEAVYNYTVIELVGY